jgi:hypothetical protein
MAARAKTDKPESTEVIAKPPRAFSTGEPNPITHPF